MIRKNLLSILTIFASLQFCLGQDALPLPNQIAKMKGTIFITETESVSGDMAYYGSKAYLYKEDGTVLKYTASDVIGFSLENGGGDFIAVKENDKKGKHHFYETLSSKTSKLYLLTKATNITDRNKPKDSNPLKDNTKYYLYNVADKKIVSENLDEFATYVKPLCSGLAEMIIHKVARHHFNMMSSDQEIRNAYATIIDDFNNNNCNYYYDGNK